MAGKNTAAFGIYRDEASVKHAVETLQRQGFRSTDISVLFPENLGNKDFAHEKATKAPEGAATGAGSGAVVGGILGWLAGVGGAAGGLAGALIGAGIPEYEAKRYEGRIKKGGILLSVHCDNSEWASKAKDILENTGADDVSSTSEARADFAKSDKPMPRTQV
jgi:hypothetical protein